MSSTSVFGPAVRVDAESGARIRRKRRAMYTVTTVVLSLIVAAGVADGLDAVDVYGVDTAHARAAGGGFELDVRYATVSRPGLATPLDITIRRPTGFTGPVRVAIDSEYLSIWDENGLDPQPSAETMTAEALIWEFDPPSQGGTLVISFDARIEPAAQQGESGFVAIVDDDGAEVVAVDFSTTVLP